MTQDTVFTQRQIDDLKKETDKTESKVICYGKKIAIIETKMDQLVTSCAQIKWTALIGVVGLLAKEFIVFLL